MPTLHQRRALTIHVHIGSELFRVRMVESPVRCWVRCRSRDDGEMPVYRKSAGITNNGSALSNLDSNRRLAW